MKINIRKQLIAFHRNISYKIVARFKFISLLIYTYNYIIYYLSVSVNTLTLIFSFFILGNSIRHRYGIRRIFYMKISGVIARRKTFVQPFRDDESDRHFCKIGYDKRHDALHKHDCEITRSAVSVKVREPDRTEDV